MIHLRGYLALSLLFTGCVEPLANTSEGASSSSGAAESSGTPTTGAGSDESSGSGGESSSGGGGSSSGEAPAVCGDGVVAGEEACDDASDEPLDGCDRKCRLTATELWTQSWDSGLKRDDEAYAVALDADGNIYVAGYVRDVGRDALLRKLDPAGKELLSVSFVGELGLDEGAVAVAVAADGSIFLGGFEALDDKKRYQGWLRKYDPAGEQLWVYLHSSAVMDGGAFVHNIVLGDGGEIYISGSHNVVDTKTYESFVERIAPDGSKALWTQVVVDAASQFHGGLALAPTGEVVLGTAAFAAPMDPRPWLGAFDPDGTLLWKQTYLPDGGYVSGVAVAEDGTIYATGVASLNTADMWVARLDAAGAELWSEYINPDYGYDWGRGIAAAPDGGFYVGGIATVTNQQQNGLVRRYDAEGVALWTDIHNDETSLYDSVEAIALGADGLVAVGTEFVLMHGQNQWVRKYAL